MSHYHCEIVMPPTDDIKAAVGQVLKRFDESLDYDHEDWSRSAFWDFWVIGGRWGGRKQLARFDAEKVGAFHDELTRRKVTVSGVTCGKQTLEPANQIPMVDALWKEHFPDWQGDSCPLFSHSNNQYDSGDLLPDDVCLWRDVPPDLKADRIIFAATNHKGDALEAKFMLTTEFWNGVKWQKTDWDGSFQRAAEMFAKDREFYRPEYSAAIAPQDDWLVVTVDYHS